MLKQVLLAGALVAMGVGCADDPASNMRQKQDAALKDPWNYSPYADDDRSVSGGKGISDFNAKAFKRDVNSVFGP